MAEIVLLTAPMLVGTQANWALISALALQVYKFYVCFPKERAWIKAMVYLLFVLQLSQTAIMSHFSYAILVLRWGEPDAFVELPWSSLMSPISGGLTSAIVQIFFARRIFMLKGAKLWARVVAWVIVLLALMQSLTGIVNEARIASREDVSELKHLLTGARVWLIGSAVCDILITLSMTFILNQYRRKTPWKQTDTLITKLIFNTVETGAVTTIIAIVEVILFVLFPTTNLGQLPAFMLGPLYALVLVVSLNVRADMAPASLIATPYSDEINWDRPQDTTDQEPLRTVHITTRVPAEISLEQSDNKLRGLEV